MAVVAEALGAEHLAYPLLEREVLAAERLE
jgi:hypothetical protein